jgi:hypothetical protein
VNRGEVAEFARRPLGDREITLAEIAGWTLLWTYVLLVASTLAVSIYQQVQSPSLNQGLDAWLQFLSTTTEQWAEPWVILLFAVAPGVLKVLAFRLETTYDPDVQFANTMSMLAETIVVIVALVGALTFFVAQLIEFVRHVDGSDLFPYGLYTVYALASVVMCLLTLWGYWRIYATPNDAPDAPTAPANEPSAAATI